MKRPKAFASSASFCAVSFLAACASPSAPPSPADLSALATQARIHVVHHAGTRPFRTESTGAKAAAFFMPFGAIPLVAEGIALNRELAPRDPVARVADRLAASLRAAYGPEKVHVTGMAAQGDDPQVLQRTFVGPLMLDVKTLSWGLANYRAKYEARTRLVDLTDAHVVWEATCTFVLDEDKPAPSLEALKADGGALLKENLEQAAEGCARQIVHLTQVRP